MKLNLQEEKPSKSGGVCLLNVFRSYHYEFIFLYRQKNEPKKTAQLKHPAGSLRFSKIMGRKGNSFVPHSNNLPPDPLFPAILVCFRKGLENSSLFKSA